MTDLDDLEKKALDWTITDWSATVIDLIARCRKAEARLAELESQSKPFAWTSMSGHGRVWSETPPAIQQHLWEPLYLRAPQAVLEGWKQFVHTLNYLIGVWQGGKGAYPQESDRYEESIEAARLMIQSAKFYEGRYFPLLQAAPSPEGEKE